MDRNEWLASLKEGDEVAWKGHIYTISRTTPTRVVIRLRYSISPDREVAFHKKNGREVGHSDPWHRYILNPVTPELRNSLERARLTAQIENALKVKEMPLDTLREIAKLASG